MTLRRPGIAVAGACASLLLAACGTPQPQAPVAQAGIVGNALTTIAASCGESYRLREFTPHADLGGLETMATPSARQLAVIAADHPAWMYESTTLARLAGLSSGYLRACGLSSAAGVLQRRRR